jgi:hypothetical protein
MTRVTKVKGSWIEEALELNSRWVVWKDFVYAILKDSKETNWFDFYFLLLTRILFLEALAKKHNEEANRGEAEMSD